MKATAEPGDIGGKPGKPLRSTSMPSAQPIKASIPTITIEPAVIGIEFMPIINQAGVASEALR